MFTQVGIKILLFFKDWKFWIKDSSVLWHYNRGTEGVPKYSTQRQKNQVQFFINTPNCRSRNKIIIQHRRVWNLILEGPHHFHQCPMKVLQFYKRWQRCREKTVVFLTGVKYAIVFILFFITFKKYHKSFEGHTVQQIKKKNNVKS